MYRSSPNSHVHKLHLANAVIRFNHIKVQSLGSVQQYNYRRTFTVTTGLWSMMSVSPLKITRRLTCKMTLITSHFHLKLYGGRFLDYVSIFLHGLDFHSLVHKRSSLSILPLLWLSQGDEQVFCEFGRSYRPCFHWRIFRSHPWIQSSLLCLHNSEKRQYKVYLADSCPPR